MGTRNLTVIIKDGKIKLSQYGQWDGYFSYTGVEFLKFVKGRLQGSSKKQYNYLIEKFKEKVDCLEDCDNKYFDEIIELADKYGNNPNKNTSKYSIPFRIMLPQFSRDTGVAILKIVDELQPYDFKGWDKNEKGEDIEVFRKKFPIKLVIDGGWIEFMNVIDLDNEEIYMFTDHTVILENDIEYPAILERYGLRCYYKSKIRTLPAIRTVEQYTKKISLDCNDEEQC